MSDSDGSITLPDGVTPNFQHPTDIIKTVNVVSMILCLSIVSLLVLMRLYIRGWLANTFTVEDYPTIFSIGLYAMGLVLSHFGGGYHQYEVTKQQMISFHETLYFSSVIYGPAAFCTKATLLLTFTRVFSPFQKAVRFIYVFMVAMLLYYIAVTTLKSVVCLPVAGFWDPTIPATCLNQQKLFIADTAMSAITDTAILTIPIPLTWSLQLPTKKKLWVMGLLGAGGLATTTSIVRLVLVMQPHAFEDETINFIRFNLLGLAEVGIGLICACPAINMIFARYSTTRTTSGTSRYANNTTSKSRTVTDLKQLSKLSLSNKLSALSSIPTTRKTGEYIEMGSRSDRDQDILLSPIQKKDISLIRTSIRGNSEMFPGVEAELERQRQRQRRDRMGDSGGDLERGERGGERGFTEFTEFGVSKNVIVRTVDVKTVVEREGGIDR